jgi:hypothetical protein
MTTSASEVFSLVSPFHERQVTMGTKNGTRGGTAAPEAAKQRPAQTIRFGRLKAAIWRQESDRGPWYSVAFARTYRDQAGNWQSSGSFGRDDLLVLAKLADQAHSWIHRQMAQDAASAGNGQTEEDGAAPEDVPF